MVGIFPDKGMTGKGEGAHRTTKDIETPVICHRPHDLLMVLDERSKLSRRQEFRKLRADLIQDRLIRELRQRVCRRKEPAVR